MKTDGISSVSVWEDEKKKSASANHAGPKDVSDFLDLEDEEEIEMIKRDAYEQVQALLNLIAAE